MVSENQDCMREEKRYGRCAHRYLPAGGLLGSDSEYNEAYTKLCAFVRFEMSGDCLQGCSASDELCSTSVIVDA